ncbi:MAG: lysophospholipid acyltransferase family protein [Candidatus Latescibacterota bacterium]|nr:MAG: lysophospholipid acyltransferase family protein [Candidatus Latescibacterota bacterium]
MRDAIEMLGLRSFQLVVRALPRSAALACGRAAGRLALRFGLRRRVCVANLERALGGELDAQEQRRVVVRSYEHLGMLLVELLRLADMDIQARRASILFDGREHLEAALERGRGAIVASAHYGNWEVLGAGGVAHGLPVTFVVQRMRNASADAMLCRTRQSVGVRVLERGMALRRVRQELESNRLVCIMCDQDARQRGIFIPFFGTPASTHKGAAQLALRLRVPFIPLFARRLPDGRNLLVARAAIEPPVGVAQEEGVRHLLARYNAALEDVIREDPGQYLWHHRRWKTLQPSVAPPQPGDERAWRQAST